MQPLNNYIVCKDLQKQKSEGFVIKTNNRFVELEVVSSSQDNVKVGDIVKVSANAGEKDEDYTIIRSTDIIYIL